jgi:Type I phosphodiesterase / nucleotide pyrophosphatase
VTFVLPSYGDGALSDLLPSALSALSGEANVLSLPIARRYVVLLIDGLGWNLLLSHASDAPYLHSLALRSRSVTCGVPSTTATSLVSLGTGLVPGAHGVVGYTSLIPGTQRLLNALHWDGVAPVSWQPHPTLFEGAASSGVAVTSVGRKSFSGSGLTIAGLRGGAYLAADSFGQRLAGAADASSRATPSLVYVYDGDLDWTGHRDGCRSEAWRHQLAVVDAFASRLRAALPSDAVLVVTGDHGMVDVPPSSRVDVDAVPSLRAGVALVGGDPRLRYLYTLPGAASDVLARWRSELGSQVVALSRAEAVAAGWFGPVEPRVLPRLGDVIVAAADDFAIQCLSAFPMEDQLVGWHGSLTADEMLVPLLIDA